MKELSIAEKELLLKDLSARLIYGVKVTNGIYTITLTPCSDTSIIIKNEHILPYLRPMSSITEEEKKELQEEENSKKFDKAMNDHLETCRIIKRDYPGYDNMSPKNALNLYYKIYNSLHNE